MMPPSSIDPGDLLDLKLMPAWVKEPSAREDYSNYQGEVATDRPDRTDRRSRGRDQGPRRAGGPPPRAGKRDDRRSPGGRDDRRPPRHQRHHETAPPKPEPPLELTVQFLPKSAVLENVVSQVKAETLAYSLFFLARSFLEKPQRYAVILKTKPESPLFQLGDDGNVSANRDFLESNAFRIAGDKFYRTEVTQSEPVKGNFASVARCRLSGMVLGPTNHHDYQRKLRGLYEQRFSRRMSFPEYQRQIETVADPAAVEKWKEDARSVTTFVTLSEEPAVNFNSGAETERDFRQKHLPNLVRPVEEVTIDGVTSRQLADRRLGRHIEQAWTVENRSPSNMMQELAKRFRDAGLHIFRHKRGMLFVSPVRVRPFAHEGQSVSPHVQAILELIATSPRIRRKEVADKLLGGLADSDIETRKLGLASDLRWLISEGYVIEFNDGALDLPKVKAKKTDETPADTTADVSAGEQKDSDTINAENMENALPPVGGEVAPPSVDETGAESAPGASEPPAQVHPVGEPPQE
jgi:hypothetical protein